MCNMYIVREMMGALVTEIHAGHNSCFCELSLIMHLAFFHVGDTVLRHCVSCNNAGLPRPFKIKQLWWLESSGISYPVIQCHISTERGLRPHRSDGLRTRNSAFGRYVSKLLTERCGSRIFKVIRGRVIFPCQYIVHNHGYSANFSMSRFADTTRIKAVQYVSRGVEVFWYHFDFSPVESMRWFLVWAWH